MAKIPLLLLLVAIFAPQTSSAFTMDAYVGLNSTHFKGRSNWEKEYGFDFGMLYLVRFKSPWILRTGVGIAQRNSDLVTGQSTNIAADYVLLEIPAVAMYPITKTWNVMGGLNFNYVLDDDDIPGSKSIVFNLPVGFRFSIDKENGVEGFYEIGITKLASGGIADARVGKSVGLKYIYTFSFK